MSLVKVDVFESIDEKGAKHTIHVFREEIAICTYRGGPDRVLGPPELFTACGQSVRRVDRGEYEITTLGARLHSKAPHAA